MYVILVGRAPEFMRRPQIFGRADSPGGYPDADEDCLFNAPLLRRRDFT